ncbi:MAG: potassium transporter Kup [Betaproteobacteria bacterium]|nr:potassium transporter Kup [Betaproteobacteria bacterium]MBV9360372.1 potassium transporter Kup [Betaproteobacteria bacterium]
MLAAPQPQSRQSTATLSLLALGVVYGDIGTSPLYAVKETFNPDHGIPLNAANVMGGVSTIFWILMIVVSLKYVTLVLRADNRGEGGIMALLAMATGSVKKHPEWTAPLLVLGVFGASLFYGDAVLTPAISVLSAIEGLEVGTAAFKPYIVPLATGILVALFLIQKQGTGFVGLLFGPVMVLWFISLGVIGAWQIGQHPAILEALNPVHALRFVTGHGFASFVVLGSVLLAITGAEALYADVGHFGKRAVRIAWFGLAAPALVLNYFGQGALLISTPKALENPFYLSYPEWALYPMVVLATIATVIASQATISGAYSMTRQAIQLGYLPRMDIEHTSAKTFGQIYIPAVNWTLLFVVAAAVIGFGSSTRLANAYGVAVMGTMLVTTFLTFFVIRFGWGYPLWLCLLATGFFMAIDLTLFGAALLKIHEGGWFPLALGAIVFLIMATWRRGREILAERLQQDSVPLGPFMKSLLKDPPQRVEGTAVYLTATPDATPQALLHSLKHFQTLHERVVFLTIEFRDVPWVPFEERVICERLGGNCWKVRVRYGFMNRPDITRALDHCGALGLEIDAMQTSYFVSRQRVVPSAGPGGMALWRERIFAAMARNAGNVTDYFNIPTNRVVELGTRVLI